MADLVAAHVAVMDHVANPPKLYNVGTGQGVSVREFVTACKKVTGVDIKVWARDCSDTACDINSLASTFETLRNAPSR